MQTVGCARLGLVGPGGVEHPHEQVAVDDGLQGLCQHRQGDGESRVGLHTVGVHGDDRNLRHTRLLQRPADKAHVVGGTASAAGLAHKHSRLI